MVFKGAATALVTPFTEDGAAVNYKAFKKLINFQIKQGIKALVIMGTTGEASTMTDEEKISVAKFAIMHAKKRVPVILGAGSNNTEHAIKMSKIYANLGADALLHVTPYYNKCTQAGLVQHFSKIANAVSLPIILYNVPGRTGVNILPETVLQLSKVKNIVAIKEASGNIDQIMEIRRICSKDFTVYGGDDGITLPVLAVGGEGLISVLSNIVPKQVNAMCENFFKGKIDKSRELQLKFNPLIKLLFCEVNPIPVKEALKAVGFNAGAARLPLTPMEDNNKEKLFRELKNLKLI